jgi:tetratricopeptide (TPR) repeat protein
MILKHRNRAARIAIRAGLLLITAALAGTGCASSYDPVVSGRDGTGNGNMARQPGPPQASQKQKDHADARAHQSLGLSYMRDGRVPLAIRELRAAVELNPKDKWSQLALAEAYRLRDLLPDAEKHALAALKLDPDFHEARLTLSGLYIQMERYPEAVKQTRVLIDDPTFPQPWTALTNQGYAQYRMGDLTEARKSLEEALEYHERYWQALLNLAILDTEEGLRQRAIERFEAVIALDPGPLGKAEANYRIAEQYISMGDRGRAVEHLVAASSQRPNGPWGKRSEDYLKSLR